MQPNLSTTEPAQAAFRIWGAIVCGHLAVMLFALALWNHKLDGLFQLLGNRFYLTAQEKQSFLKYGLGLPLLFFAALHGAARRLSRGRGDYRIALAALCRALWPCGLALICCLDFFTPFRMRLPGLIELHVEPLKLDLMLLLLIAAFALSAGAVVQAYLLFKQTTDRAPRAALDSSPDKSHFWPGLTCFAALCYTLYFSYYTIQRYLSVQANLHDFSLYDQLLWNLLHGNGFRCTLWQSEILTYDLKRFGYDFNAEHFMPALLLLLPFYASIPHPAMLLIAQALALGAAALPVYCIALSKLQAPRAAFVFALAWLLHPIVQHTNMKEFHLDAFVPLFLLGAYALLLHQRIRLYWIAIALALGCKEDVALSVAFFGIFLILGERRRKVGGATLLVGLLYGFLVIQILIPHWRDGEPARQLYRFQHLLPAEQQADPDHLMTTGDLLKACLLRPLHVIEQTATQERWISLLKLGAPFALLILCSGWIALWALPSLASNLLSDWDRQFMLTLHYGIAIVPPFAAASIWGLARWARLGARASSLRDSPDHAQPGARASRPHESPESLAQARLTGGIVAILVGALLTQYYFGYLPGCDRFPKDDFAITDHARKLRPFIAAIPPQARLSATVRAGTFAARRESIYLFPELQDANFILIDTRGPEWPLKRDEFRQRTLELLHSAEWGLKLPYRDGYLLFEKGRATDLNLPALEQLDFRSAY